MDKKMVALGSGLNDGLGGDEAKTRINRAMKAIGKLEAKIGTLTMQYSTALEIAALICMTRAEILGKRMDAKEALQVVRNGQHEPA
jgi:hypothetical protein